MEEWVFGTAAHSGGVLTSYPPGFPALQAASFHAMGSADVVTLNLNYWFLTLGFAAAAAGLLAPRVRGVILLPVLLLMLVLPGLTGIPVPGGADRPLAYLVATAALLVVLWLDERQDLAARCCDRASRGRLPDEARGARARRLRPRRGARGVLERSAQRLAAARRAAVSLPLPSRSRGGSGSGRRTSPTRGWRRASSRPWRTPVARGLRSSSPSVPCSATTSGSCFPRSPSWPRSSGSSAARAGRRSSRSSSSGSPSPPTRGSRGRRRSSASRSTTP